MTNYRKEKRPPRYRDDDYVLRALYKLLSEHFGEKCSPYSSSLSRRLPRRGSGGMGGYRGPSVYRGSYAPRSYKSSYSPDKGGSAFVLPRKPEPSYPRESKPMVQSLPLPRHGPDIETLMERLEKKIDSSLVEQVLERLDAESEAMEKAVKALSPESKPLEKADANQPDSESTVPEIEQDGGSLKTDSVKAESVKPSDTDSLESDLYDKLDSDELDWLDEEMNGLVVEAKELGTEMEKPDLEILDRVDTDIKDIAPPEPTGLVRPELEAKPFEPLIEAVDPLKSLEPGIIELQEEADDGEAEPL